MLCKGQFGQDLSKSVTHLPLGPAIAPAVASCGLWPTSVSWVRRGVPVLQKVPCPPEGGGVGR